MHNAGHQLQVRSVAIPLAADRVDAMSPEGILSRLLDLTRIAFRIGRRAR